MESSVSWVKQKKVQQNKSFSRPKLLLLLFLPDIRFFFRKMMKWRGLEWTQTFFSAVIKLKGAENR